MTRSVDITTEIAAPVEAVWAALTQADLLARWFSPTAEGHDNVIRFAWGDMGWESYLVDLGTHRHLGWGDGPDGPIGVDWHLETKGGHTVVRLVQSGIKEGAEWDDAYEAYHAGWRYFLLNLKHYLTRHRGVPRAMAWTRRPTQMARPVLWDQVMSKVQGEDVMRRAIVQESKAPRAFSATLPDLNDALLFVELEGKTLGVYLSTYGLPSERVQALQQWVDDISLVAT